METAQIKLVIEFIDDKTGFIAGDLNFTVENAARLRDILKLESTYDGPFFAELGHEQFLEIAKYYNLTPPGKKFRAIRVRPWRAMDGLPYIIHTNRELPLMLTGKKPLAVFSSQYARGSEKDEGLIQLYRKGFEPYVTSGIIAMREVIQDAENDQVHQTLFYALPQEVWRIDAYLMLKSTSKKSGWSEGFERMEGSLLGYTDDENDLYIDLIYGARLRSTRTSK